MIEDIRISVKGKSALGGAFLLLPFLTVIELFQRDGFYNGNSIGYMIMFILGNINALIHELGHFSVMGLSIFGNLIYDDFTFWKDLIVTSGTLFQIGWPVVALVVMLRSKEYLGAALCLEWIAISIYHTAWYMSSARADGMFASSNFLGRIFDAAGKKGEHDWFWMFKRLNLLDQDIAISGYVHDFAFMILIAGLIFGLFIIYLTWLENRS